MAASSHRSALLARRPGRLALLISSILSVILMPDNPWIPLGSGPRPCCPSAMHWFNHRCSVHQLPLNLHGMLNLQVESSHKETLKKQRQGTMSSHCKRIPGDACKFNATEVATSPEHGEHGWPPVPSMESMDLRTRMGAPSPGLVMGTKSLPVFWSTSLMLSRSLPPAVDMTLTQTCWSRFTTSLAFSTRVREMSAAFTKPSALLRNPCDRHGRLTLLLGKLTIRS